MNELRYTLVSLFCVAAVLSCLPANAEPLFAEAEKNLLAVGRENPFAAVFRKEEIKPEQKKSGKLENMRKSEPPNKPFAQLDVI